jgi:hypothetical protein
MVSVTLSQRLLLATSHVASSVGHSDATNGECRLVNEVVKQPALKNGKAASSCEDPVHTKTVVPQKVMQECMRIL